jgi:ribose/xylose/arabinose/galactoside ABC-type transport system permease subunit
MKRLEAHIPFVIDNLIWFLLFFVLLLASLFTPNFLTQRNTINILEHSSVLGIMVIGQSLCLLSGNFDLSAESALGLTALLGAYLVTAAGAPAFGSGLQLPPVAALAIVFLVGLAVGWLNGFLITRLKMNNFIVTLAMLIILRGLTMVLNEGKTISSINPGILALGSAKIGVVPISVLVMLVFYGLAHILTRYIQFGRDLYAVGGNRDAALASGVDSDRRIRQVYIISGLIAAFCGWMFLGRLGSGVASMGTGMIFEIQAAAVIGGISLFGGRGSILGALGGVLLLSAISSILALMQVSTFWYDTIRGGIILLAMLIDAQKVNFRKKDVVSAISTRLA